MEKRWNESAYRAWAMAAAYDEPLPIDERLGLPTIAALWDRARALFERVIRHTGPLEAYARIFRVRSPQRRVLLNWLVPVECTVRCLLMARAVAWLATPEGRKVWDKTPKIALAARFAPRETAAPQTHVESIPYPGWNTIARNQRPAPPAPLPEPPAPDRDELVNHRRAFRLCRWKRTPSETQPDKAKLAKRKNISPLDLLAKRIECNQHYAPQGLSFAARIEALGRVLENPERDIRRMARMLASFDHETTDCFGAPAIPEFKWLQGERETRQSFRHANRGMGGLKRMLEPG